MITEDEFIRYSSQLCLPQFGIESQEKLKNAHVMIVGMGGLGAPVAMYLAAAGIGKLTLVDHDRVEEYNLQRQIIHDNNSINVLKVESAKKRLQQLNTEVQIQAIPAEFTIKLAEEIAQSVSVIVDCTDNISTRRLINAISYECNIPLVSGSAVRFEGQVSVFNQTMDSPCYLCLYPDNVEMNEYCWERGVLPPIVGIIGSIQATEVIKVLCQLGDTLDGYVLQFDACVMEWRKFRIKKRANCLICSKAK